MSEPILLAPKRVPVPKRLPWWYRALPILTVALGLLFVAGACSVASAVFDHLERKALCP